MQEQVPAVTIGRITSSGRLKINDLIDTKRSDLAKAYYGGYDGII